MMEAMHEKETRTMKFQASLQGVDLDGGGKNDRFEAVKERAMAKLNAQRAEASGTTAEAIDLAGFGIKVELEE